MYLFCISCKQIVATIKVPTLVYNVFLMRKGRSPSYAVCNFSCISFYKRPDYGSQLQLKHVDLKKWIKTSVLWDWFNTRASGIVSSQNFSPLSDRNLLLTTVFNGSYTRIQTTSKYFSKQQVKPKCYGKEHGLSNSVKTASQNEGYCSES